MNYDFRKYEPGSVLRLSLDEGNGILKRDYLFCGINNSEPVFVSYEDFIRTTDKSNLNPLELDGLEIKSVTNSNIKINKCALRDIK